MPHGAASASSMQPKLPAELERNIFRLAARIDQQSIFTLILVARRVRAWGVPLQQYSAPCVQFVRVEPLMYQTISIYRNRPRLPNDPIYRHAWRTISDLIDTKLAAGFFRDVRNVCLVDPDEEWLFKPFAACRSLTDLAVFIGNPARSVLPRLAALPLRRLSINLHHFFPPGMNIDFTHALFTQITHLQLFDEGGDAGTWAGLGRIPNLTHLAFTSPAIPNAVYADALAHCESLQVLLGPRLDSWIAPVDLEAAERRALSEGDQRFVMLMLGQRDRWEAAAAGGDGYWAEAEQAVETLWEARSSREDAVSDKPGMMI